ncbi:multidrug efflux system protein MdtO [Cupriavidus basilensis OR16]|uniref:Multidrug efflux system protein MdtO n=1 Tax=Cupriavidus basilensis OR16 TaxID=1127483 RepID=H1S245_9BURK|nr:FUSC family protein [Cupriavidus basilensis]EHP43411.1 multidrug efflux system protein MdtO [Cupriavidus basilensis OR16]
MNRFLQFLRDELTPFPGRTNVTLRCVASAVIVIVISMTLQAPFLALSLLVTFFATQSNVVITRITGILFLAGTTLALSSTILLLKFTFDYPLLRIVFASLILFCCVYAMRVFQLGIVFFIGAIVTIYVQSLVDVAPNAEALIRGILWVWVSVCYPIALTLIINTLLLPAEPRHQLRQMLVSKLTVVQARLGALLGCASGPRSITALDVEGTTTALQKLLRFTAMRGRRDEIAEARDLATVTTVSNLYVAASNLRQPSSVSKTVGDRVRILHEACGALADAIGKDEPFSIAEARSDCAVRSTSTAGLPWALVAMDRALLELDAFTAAQGNAMNKSPRQPVLAADAFSNPVYAEFALKTSLAVLVCYLFYNSTDWQGAHTVMLTCLIVAQPSLGASSRRSLLRFWGAAIGSLLALFEIVFILPRIDGIVALIVNVLPVLLIGAWVAAGSERISYAGVQIWFTFSLAFLEQFTPTSDLTEIRDRMVGIFLGIVIATFVQMSLWPEGEAALLRRRLSASLLSTARLLQSLGHPTVAEDSPDIGKQRMAAWAALNDCEGMLLRVALEPTWREGEEERVALRANSVLVAAREFLLAADALRSAIDVAGDRIPTPLSDAARDFASSAGSAIMAYATGLEEPTPCARPPKLTAPKAYLVGSGLEEGAEGNVAELRAEVNRVLQAVSGLPEWVGEAGSRVPGLPASVRAQ